MSLILQYGWQQAKLQIKPPCVVAGYNYYTTMKLNMARDEDMFVYSEIPLYIQTP